MDALLINAGIETYYSQSPSRLWVVVPIAVYVAVSLWAVFLGARLAAPGIVTQTPAPFYVFLGLLVAMTQDRSNLEHGITMLKHSMPVILPATAMLVALLGAGRLAFERGAWPWLRVTAGAVGLYAAAALAFGLLRATPYLDLINGHSEWQRLPYWLQGAYIGAVVIPPVAFTRELILSMKVAAFRGYLRWMVVFALATWIAVNLRS